MKLLTHEIGSLAKPPWLVKTSAGRPLDETDIEHARTWGEKVGVAGHEELVEALQRGEPTKAELGHWASSRGSSSVELRASITPASTSLSIPFGRSLRCVP